MAVQLGKKSSSRSLLRVASNKDLQEQEEARRKAEEVQNSPVVVRLAGHIRSAFETAVSDRATISERLLKCLRQREGVYESDEQKLIEQSNGTTLYMMLTDIKCRALESWLKDIMLPSGERPYAIEPTPKPDVPPEIVQQAQMAFLQDYLGRVQAQAQADGVAFDINNPDMRMIDQADFKAAAERFEKDLLGVLKERAREDAESLETIIDDELKEGGWYKVLSEFIIDFSTYPTAFMEGPIYRRKKVMEWVRTAGRSELVIKDKVVKEYERIRPFDVYPSPGSRSLQDGNLCLRKRYSRADLEALRGVDGFDSNVIDTVLDQYANGYREFLAYDTEVEDLHNRPGEASDPEGHIDGIKFYGNVQGFMLREWGMDIEEIPDPFKEYPIVAYLIGSYVIGARINPHPLGRRNIYSASFRKKNDSIWGQSPPDLMRDIQKICNSSARAMCNNSAVASGPQVWQLIDAIPAECDPESIYPWKIWQFSSEKLKFAGQKPMEFYQPALIVGPLLELYDYFFKQGSETTGIPAYIYGNEGIGGAGSTASGLSMLMNAAAKGLRNAASNIDDGVIAPSIEEHWLSVMLTRPDLAKGDCKIVARASEYLVQQEANQIRRTEFLDRTNNPTDMEIIGYDGRRELLKESAKALKMNPDKIVPDREKMMATQVQQQVQQVIVKLSQALNIPPEQLMAALQVPERGGARGGGRQLPAPKELDAAGNPMAGQDVRMFNQQQSR